MKGIISDIYKHLNDKNHSEELGHHLKRFSANVNKSVIKDEEKEDDGVYHYFLRNVSIMKKKKRISCCLLLTQYCLSVFSKEKNHLVIPLNEIFCVHPISAIMQKKKNRGMFIGCIKVSLKKFFKFEFFTRDRQNEDQLVKIVQQITFFGKIQEDFRGMDRKKRKLLCIINPVSGAKKSEEIFKNTVRPIFELCHFTFDSITTEYAGHGTEITRKFDPRKYTDIVSVGGDGLLWELIQGLFQHPFLPYQEIKKISISMIPTGTGNGLSWCMGSSLSPFVAALITARGRTVPYNIISTITPKKRMFSFLFFSYGALPDVDLGYKSIKWMGDFKYVVGGAISCIARTTYPMEMKYVQLEGETSSPRDPYEFPKDFGNVYQRNTLENPKGIQFLRKGEKKEDPPLTLLERHFGEELKKMLEEQNKESSKTKKKKKKKEEEDEDEEEEGEGEGEEEEEEEEEEEVVVEEEEEEVVVVVEEEEKRILEDHENYDNIPTVLKTISDPAFYLTVGNARKFSIDFWGAGRAVPGNGYVDLLWAGKVGFFEALPIFSKMIGANPDFLDEDGVKSARIKAFYFVPKGPKYSLVDIDGEEFPVSPVMGMVHKGLLSICHLEVPFHPGDMKQNK